MKKKSTKSGYRPSDSVKKRIAAWEGSAMTGAIDPLSGKWGKNRSFEEEASSFYHALPTDIREQVISNPGLADNLFSYSYNVGAGRFKERVVPALRKYYAGKGSAEEIASSMWASGDKKLRGLRNRRAVERQGVVDSLAPSPIQPVFDVPTDNTFVFNPFPVHAESTTVAPIMVPDTYVEAHRLTPSEDRVNRFQEAMEARRQYNNLMDAISIQNNPAPQYTPQTNPANAPYVVASYDKGGYLRKSWNDLSMSEKAEMMKVAVRNGITNLQDIRDKYNEFAEGGDTDWSYNSWKRQIAKHMGIRPDEDNTYDYEAYFRKYPKEAWKMLSGDPTAHFSDEFKTVYHPTFSSKSIGNDGSIYSGVRNSKTNPQGLVGGTWSPDYHTFTMSPDGYRGPVSMDDRKWYLENNEDNGVVLREADGSLPVYDGIPWGGVLPNIIINGSRRGRKFEDGGFTSELDWSPDSWFSKRVAKPDGTLYNDEEAARLASHVPEYNNIEQTAKTNGTWLKMPDGSTWEGDPRSWVMMQSESYKKNYSPKPWYTGQAEWPTTFDYGEGKVDTNKVTRAPYYNNQMWFSDSKDYGQTFADYQNSTGLGWRFDTPGEENIKGHNFLSAIPKEGNYRTLESPANGKPDQWQRLPFVLEDGTINRLPESQISVDSKGRNIRADKQKVLTDDVVNWSKDLGDQGIFMQNIDDGAIIKNGEIHRQPVNEFISQPGFTDKVKFIEGNTGDFDIDNPYKYANNFYVKDNSLDNNYAALGGPLVEAAMNEYRNGGKIHIKPSHRGKLTDLKKRTGKTETELYNDGNPAHKKMVVFARSARKWKHGLGGNLYGGGGFASLVTTPVLPDAEEIRHRLYNGVNPAGYQYIPERIWDALNKKEANRSIYRDDQWATYLQIPEEERHSRVEKLQPARYRPSIGDTSGDVYRLPLNEEDTDVLIQRAQMSGLGLGKNMVDRSLGHYLGDHTVGRGHDKKGEYISYYDKYDLNPFTGGTPVKTGIKSVDKWLQTNTVLPNIDLSMGIGKPFELYDRIYLDDYYGVPKEARGGNFLPEITVTGKKRKK